MAREPLHPRSHVISIRETGPNVLTYYAEGKVKRAGIERVFAELDRRLPSGEKIRT